MTFKKSEVVDIVCSNYRALEAACGQAGLERMLDRLYDVCERQEKEHLAFGRRLLGRSPKRKQALSTTARFFAVKVASENETYKAMASEGQNVLSYLAGCREDYQIGAMLGAALAERTGNTFKPTASFAQLDYCEHFAVKE